MLEVVVPDRSGWDESRSEFVEIQGGALRFEHSLVALSKWESKTCRPFMDGQVKSDEDLDLYFNCMCLTPETQHLVPWMSTEDRNKLVEYIEAPMTATTITDRTSKSPKSTITTSEVVYGWMVSYNIPFDPCENWHIARLMMLIRVCGIQQDPKPKKTASSEIAANNAALNAARRAQYNTKG